LARIDFMSIPHAILIEIFGYHAFRGHQEAAIAHVIAGGDALVLMPTGGGKSLCYQIPAIARARAGHGVSIVVSPLIALMHDQVGALQEAGVQAAFLNSTLDGYEAADVEKRMFSGTITLLYVAPERLNTPRFLALLTSLYERQQLSMFAIDEVHCVSQWGHDFRPEYRSLTLLHERFPNVPRVALTATADALTRTDIVERLELQSAQQYVSSFDRPNIRYAIVEKVDARKQLLKFIKSEHAGDAGIVYCQSRKKVEETSAFLEEQGIRSLPYHAGLDMQLRQANQDAFLRTDVGEDNIVMVATIAFGMGIDKPNVRFVAHLDMPKNIEGYYQETGRAGRDGEGANAWMAYGLQDVVNQRHMIDESPASDAYKTVMRGKLEALLGLAEATDCRRGRLLRYFGQEVLAGDGVGHGADKGTGQARYACGNCDNCLTPAVVWDATEAARKALSCIYRVQQSTGIGFGAGHIMDILRGKKTDKMAQFGHESLSTFGIGTDISEQQWRSVLRQLIAIGALRVDAQAFNTLALTDMSRTVLKGDMAIEVRESAKAAAPEPRSAKRYKSGSAAPDAAKPKMLPADLSFDAQERFMALKAWRTEVAKQHNLPAYVIFHDATLVAIANSAPHNKAALSQISGLGERKLATYGDDVLRIVAGAAPAAASDSAGSDNTGGGGYEVSYDMGYEEHI
jgi:ATP-dependent DNA helicase RecQ